MTRLIQLSDTHIVGHGERAYGVVDTAAALARAVSTIRDLLPLVGPVDGIIVSGDLTDFGKPEEYLLFREILAPLDIPLAVVPGNHDSREPMRKAFSDLQSMPASGPINWHLAFEGMHVIGLDTLVEGEAHGILTDETLVWLQATLKNTDERPTLIVMHHPPVDSGIGHMDRQGLTNADSLFAILASYRRQITLSCGHVHRMIATVREGCSVFIAPSPSHAVALDHRPDGPSELMLEPGGFLLHRFPAGGKSCGIVTEHVPVGRYPGPYPFFPDKVNDEHS